MSGEITLPEITIVGDPNAVPQNEADWYTQGFVDGYNSPDTEPTRPLMINDTLAAIYIYGVEAGRQSARERQAEIEAMLADQPQIGPDLGGESFEKAQEDYNRLLEELFHQHMPHTELEGGEGPADGPPRIVEPPGIRPIE